ncbi:MAG: GPR endopeptidase [Ruminococcaceae bacterium]|nr:GPR endopeptidase [Oscillospiraceae bacterium]
MSYKRTDLALDAAGTLQDDCTPLTRQEYISHNILTYKIIIDNDQSVKRFFKPFGTYITFLLSKVWQSSRDEAMNAARAIRDELVKLLPEEGTVLIVGLGNINITADNIGPKVSHRIIVTRHLKDDMPESFEDFHSVCAISPGVLGLTGIETGEIIKGVADRISPAAIIAIDALATSDLNRLGNTIQICDSGIAPGSGVGNYRFAINRETFGVPVIAIGIPTVVEAGTMVRELIGDDYDIDSKIPDMPLVVTPKDIDVLSDKSAEVIACGINLALHRKIDERELMEFMA